jgi:hypothetical protein
MPVKWFLRLWLLCAVQPAIAAGLPIPLATDPLTADEQSDRTEHLEGAIDATLDAAQAKAAPAISKEFSVGINAPLYYNSNAAGHASLEGNPEIALGWSPNLTMLPLKPSVKLKASVDRYTNVPQINQDQASVSFNLPYHDANNDQAWSPFFFYKRESIYAATFSPWIATKNDFALGTDKVFNFDADFRLLPAAPNSGSDATWTLGVTEYVQRRTRSPPPGSLAVYVVPSATYTPSAEWVILLSMETSVRWFDQLLAKASRRDVEIEPVLTIGYDPSNFLGHGAPQIALQIDYDRHLSNLPRKSYQVWSVGPVLSAKWKF